MNPIPSLGQASVATMIRMMTMTIMVMMSRRKRMINVTVDGCWNDSKDDDLIIEWYREDLKQSIYSFRTNLLCEIENHIDLLLS